MMNAKNEIILPNGGTLRLSAGIGGTEASAILGCNPYMNSVQLWEYKTGRREKADLSKNPLVQNGIKSEPFIRGLIECDRPDLEIHYKEFDFRRNKQNDFMICVLDGEAFRTTSNENKEAGTLEIKTVNVLNHEHIARNWGNYKDENGEWKRRVPQNYYIQVIHSMAVCNHQFADLVARFRFFARDTSVSHCSTEYYHWERKEVLADIDFLMEKERVFWEEFVLKDVRPPLVLPAI